MISNKLKILYLVLVVVTAGLYFQACSDDLLSPDNTIEFFEELSDYGIFKGTVSDLIPTDSFRLYELSSQLFTDYAEKQRLVKLPEDTKMTAVDNGLVDLPDGTILVKTFFYYHDKRDIAKGKKIVETRLLIKSAGNWNVGVYQWNDGQTNATLVTSGLNKTVNWVNSNGSEKIISYHIPNNNECATCHNSNSTVNPIGPKVMNLNRSVVRNGITQNQLQYFLDEGMLYSVDPTSFDSLPDYNNTALSLEKKSKGLL